MVVRKELFFGISAGCIFLLDMLTKLVVLKTNPQIVLGFLQLHLVTNTGAGFGILQGKSFVLGILSGVVLLFILFFYKKIEKEKIPQILWGLFTGGVAGNLVDRLFRGYVIDFVDVGFWPAFNVADAAMSIAIVGLLFYYWKNKS